MTQRSQFYESLAKRRLGELGLAVVEPGRLLVIDHQQDPLPRGDSIMFVYDLGAIEDPSTLQLNASELSDFAFVGIGELADVALHRLARRVRAALAARAENSMVELIDGERRT